EGWLRVRLIPDPDFEDLPFPVRVSCINKPQRDDPTRRIQAIGGTHRDGSHWKLSLDEAIRYVESGRFNFYTFVNNEKRNIVVDVSPRGNKFLRTEGDERHENDLLALDECPKGGSL